MERIKEITGCDDATAEYFSNLSNGDVELGVEMFFEAGGVVPQEASEGQTTSTASSSNDTMQQQNAKSQHFQPNIVDGIVSAAKEAGPPAKENNAFIGKSNRLTTDQSDSQISDTDSELKATLIFYADGFILKKKLKKHGESTKPSSQKRSGVHTAASFMDEDLDDMPPLRPYEGNEDFLAEIKASRVPIELQELSQNRKPIPVSITIQDQRPQKCPQQKNTKRAFTGTGNTLGGSKRKEESKRGDQHEYHVPREMYEAGMLESAVNLTSSVIWGVWDTVKWAAGMDDESQALAALVRPEIDNDFPKTTVQVKLSDGSTLQINLNLKHTVGDLYLFCKCEIHDRALKKYNEAIQSGVRVLPEPPLASSLPDFSLAAGFPPSDLTDMRRSIKDAGLINARVTQKISSNRS